MATIPYDEKNFSIDLISDAYNTKDPFIIVEKVKEDLDVNVTIRQVIEQLNTPNNIIEHTINMKQLF